MFQIVEFKHLTNSKVITAPSFEKDGISKINLINL